VIDSKLVEDTYQRHGFVTLSTGLDGVRLAVLNYDSYGIACCDVIAYRIIDGEGMTLKDEAALLSQALLQIRQQLCLHPNLLSIALNRKTISFLGKKVHILCDSAGHPLQCRLQPLILLSEQASQQSTNGNSNPLTIPNVPITQLNQYLEQNFTENNTSLLPTRICLNPLRRSYKLLGIIPLVLFPILGISGLLFSFGWSAVGGIIGLFAGIIPLLLLLAAIGSFRDFQQHNVFTVRIVSEDESISSMGLASRAETPENAQYQKEAPEAYEGEPSKTWTTTTIAAFLQDSIESALVGTLNSYRTEDWNAYSLHLRTFMVNGIRLSILKHSGQEPPEQLGEILEKIPYPDIRKELETWLQRLVATNRGTPLTLMEAQMVANFAVSLLQKVQILPSDWEARIYSIIPRRKPLRPQVHEEATISSIPESPALQAPSAIPTTSSEIMGTSKSIQPILTIDREKKPDHVTPDVLNRLPVRGVPLRVVSKHGMDELIKLMQAGASPYLFVFANRYLSSWSNLSKLVDQVAETMGSKVNVAIFPVLGDSKINDEVQKFIAQFHIEGSSTLSPLPFIFAVSRTVLFHIIESGIPIPSELIIAPHSEGFIERVREAITVAKAYQINLEDLPSDESEIALETSPVITSTEEPTLESPSTSSTQVSSKLATFTTPELLADTDDVVEEVISTSPSNSNRRVMEVDIVAAKQRRELATMVPVALAVVHLPEDQSLLDILEVAAQQEPHLVAQFVDIACSPEASKILQIPRGSVRLRFDGTEQTLENPESEHLLACIHQLRAIKSESSHSDGNSPDDSCSEQKQMTLPTVQKQSSNKSRRRRRTSQKNKQKA
jgi:hypothetical protein